MFTLALLFAAGMFAAEPPTVTGDLMEPVVERFMDIGVQWMTTFDRVDLMKPGPPLDSEVPRRS